MKRAHLITAVLVSFGLTTACGPGERSEPEDDLGLGTTTSDTERRTDTGVTTSAPSTTAGLQMTVRGCVTEQNNQLMLTQVESVAGQPGQAGRAGQAGAQSFQLVGDTQQLRQHVGQRVQVMGESAQQTAQIGEPGAQAGATTPGGADREPIGTAGAAGSTLRVASITPVEGECPSPANR